MGMKQSAYVQLIDYCHCVAILPSRITFIKIIAASNIVTVGKQQYSQITFRTYVSLRYSCIRSTELQNKSSMLQRING